MTETTANDKQQTTTLYGITYKRTQTTYQPKGKTRTNICSSAKETRPNTQTFIKYEQVTVHNANSNHTAEQKGYERPDCMQSEATNIILTKRKQRQTNVFNRNTTHN